MTRGSIISLGVANPAFNPQTDQDGVADTDSIVASKGNEFEMELDDSAPPTAAEGDTPAVKAAPTELKASLNLVHAVSLAVGQTIGSGIFISPNDVVKQVGSVGMSLVIWFLSGLLSMCGALTFCELGTMFKRSGGEFQYIKAAYGNLAAFLYLWVCGIIRNGMGCAAIALSFSQYFVTLFWSLDGDETPAEFLFVKKLVATAAIVLIVCVNIYSTKIGLYMQNVFTVLKLAALGVLILLGFYKICAGQTEYIGRNWFEGTKVDIPAWTTAFFAALWSYNGWNCINMMAGEIKNPTKTVPRALVTTNAIMITIYLVANVAYHTTLSLEVLMGNDPVAMAAGRSVLGQINDTWGKVGEIFFGLSVAISTFGALSSSLMGSSRLPFIAAQEEFFPRFVGLIQTKNGTPIVGLLTMGTLATFWVWPVDLSSLIRYVGFLSWAWWGLCFAAVPGLRLTMPDYPRTFRVFLAVPFFACAGSLYLTIGPFFESPLKCAAWLAVAAVGAPIYYGFVDQKQTCKGWMNWLLKRLSVWLGAKL